MGLCLRGVMVKTMEYRIVVSEFEFHSHYYIHIRTNTRRKGKNSLILPAQGLNNTTTALLVEWPWH